MTDPERLIDEHPSAFARAMLRAATDEEPPASLLAHTLAAAGLAGGLGAAEGLGGGLGSTSSKAVALGGNASGSLAAPAAIASPGVWGAALKVVGVAAVGGSVAAGAVFGLPEVSSERAPAPSAVVAPRSPTTEAPPSPEVVAPVAEPAPAPVVSAPLPHATSRRSATPRSPADTRLRDEARVIDEARAALAAGDASGTLRALEAHRRGFERPLFEPEALFLRMQALRLRGQASAARRTGERLLSISPNGPHASSVRAFLRSETP